MIVHTENSKPVQFTVRDLIHALESQDPDLFVFIESAYSAYYADGEAAAVERVKNENGDVIVIRRRESIEKLMY